MKWFSLLTVAGAARTSPVGKVVELLNDLAAKVKDDLATTSKQVEEYKVYCHEEQRDRGFAIKSAQKEIDQNSAIAENAAAKISNSNDALQEASARGAAAEQELKEAKAQHADQDKLHNEAIKELKSAHDMISRAISVLKREMVSFLQGGQRDKDVDAELKKVLPALQAIVASADLSVSRKLNAFLAQEPEQEGAAPSPPQAKKVVYESRTGGIVDELVELREKAEDQLQARIKEQMTDKHDFEMLQQSLKGQISNAAEAAADAKKQKARAEQEQAAAEAAFAEASNSKKSDEDFVASLNASCRKTAAGWTAREKEGKEEIKAIKEAVKILEGGVVVSLAQTHTKLTLKRKNLSTQRKNDNVRDQLSELLKGLGKKFSNFSLMDLGNSAEKDPFVKVKKMINNMITKLQNEAQEEATKEQWCKEEQEKSQKSRDAKQSKVDEYQARVDSANAKLDQLAASVQDLATELGEIQNATAEATKLRNEQHTEFVKSEAEYSQSVDAVTQAISVLSEYYNKSGASFLEQPMEAPTIRNKASTDAGGNIIAILETALSDFSRTLAEKKMDEADQQQEYDDLMQKSKVNSASKEAEKKGKESMIKQLRMSLESHKEDLKSSSDELDAVLDYIEKLKPQCTVKLETYEEKKAKRENEIAGLTEALNILEGEGV